MVFVEPCNLMIDGEEENWLGFVNAIKKIVRQNDQMIKARFQKLHEFLNEGAVKTNRAIKNQYSSLNSISFELKTIQKDLIQVRHSQKQIPPSQKEHDFE